jgi:hypothetical protein
MARQPRRGKTVSMAQSVVDDQDGPVQGNDEVATKTWKNWREGRNHLSGWRQEAAECYDMAAGHQWTSDEQAALKSDLRPIVTFNRTGVVIDSVSGYEINSRQDVTYLPREVTDSGPVQVENEAAKYFRQQCEAEDEESDAFTDLLTCGLAVVEHRMDYEDDPEGMLKVERTDPLEMVHDPSATKRNLVDRRWDIRGKWWEKSVAEATFPDANFDEGTNIAGDLDDLESKSPIDRRAASFYKDTGIGDQSDRRRGKVFILEHTWFEREAFISYADPLTGKMADATPEEFKKINDKLGEMAAGQGIPYVPPQSVKRTRKVFKRAFVYGRDTLNKDDLEAPCPHGFHYQFMTGKRDRNKNIWFGLVRSMKDPQRWANKFLSQTMHMINANVKGGIIADEGAFEDQSSVESKLAKPGWVLTRKPGMNVEFVPPTPMPNNTFNLMQFAIGSVRDTTGVNLELLGMADRDQPGVLEHSRKQSAMAILAPFFDSMRRYRKAAGRLTLYFIKEYLSDGRMIRIVGDQGANMVPLTKQDGFDKYDVVVDEAPSSPNQKEQAFASISAILPTLVKMGAMPPPEALDYVPGLPAQLAQKWKASLGPKPPNPMQEQAAQLEMADKQADVAKKSAEAKRLEAEAQARVIEAQQKPQFEQQKFYTDTALRQRELDLNEADLALRHRQAQDAAAKDQRDLAVSMWTRSQDREDVAMQRQREDMQREAEANTIPPEPEERSEDVLSRGLSDLGQGLQAQAQALVEQGRAIAEGMTQMAQAVMAEEESEAIRDPASGKVIGAKKRRVPRKSGAN